VTEDWKARLALLRGRIARIDHKYRVEASSRPLPVHYEAERLLSGQVVENRHGCFFLSEKIFPAHRRHGGVELSRLVELEADLLPDVSGGEIPAADPRRWAFLDTETTGLAGGAGTCAFLVGVGTIEEAGFRVRLFFMRDYDEEAAMLAALAELLAGYQVLVSYNGKAYDAPLLRTRYRLARLPDPLDGLAHLDLLFAARRLWRLRLESCRLIELEREILGFEREGDLPGEMIPYYYFEYLRTRQAFRLVPLFHHNTMDILTLAALAAVVLPAFASPAGSGLRHGEDLLGLARWLARKQDPETALEVYRRAVDQGLADSNLFRALWEMAGMERKRGRPDRAVEIWRDLAASRNPWRRQALEELAKHYEHRQRDYRQALEATAAALEIQPLPALERRRERLERRAAREAERLI